MRAVICKTFGAYDFDRVDVLCADELAELAGAALWLRDEEARAVQKTGRKARPTPFPRNSSPQPSCYEVKNPGLCRAGSSTTWSESKPAERPSKVKFIRWRMAGTATG